MASFNFREANKKKHPINSGVYNSAVSGATSIKNKYSGGSSRPSRGSSSSNRFNTTITDADGSKHSGYIEDGKSYYSDGKGINYGSSVVDAQGKTWTKKDPNAGQSIQDYLAKYGVTMPSGNVPNYGTMNGKPQYNPYEDMYNDYKDKYEAMQNQIAEQNRLAVEQGVNRLNAQRAGINQSADDSARQAYINFMQQKKALPQQLAMQGATGGATETANLGLQTAYQNNVNAINLNKANAMQDIDNAITDLRNTGNLKAVEQALANNQNMLNTYMNLADKGIDYSKWANQFNANLENRENQLAMQQNQLDQQEWDRQRYETEYANKQKQNEIDNILAMMNMGLVDTEKASALLGVPADQIGNFVELTNRLKEANINKTNYRGKTGGGSSGKPTSASSLNTILKTAMAMMNEKEDVFGDKSFYRNAYGDDDIKAYILSQNISDEEQYKILNNLGLLEE